MYLHLYHGRKDPAADMDDWGEDGPTLEGVVHLQWTYTSINVLFATQEACETARAQTGWGPGSYENSLEMTFSGDMVDVVVASEIMYFGDWCLRADAPGEKSDGN